MLRRQVRDASRLAVARGWLVRALIVAPIAALAWVAHGHRSAGGGGASGSSIGAPTWPSLVAVDRPRLPVGEGGRGSVIVVDHGEVLATVDGRVLGPVDLGLAPGGGAIDGERLAFLLDRAIDRELVLARAAALGVTLDAIDRAALARRTGAGSALVFDDLGRDAAVADALRRDAEAAILRARLARLDGGPAPSVTAADVAGYLREHPEQLAWLPVDAAARDVIVRRRLAAARRELHAAEEARYVARLRAAADVRLGARSGGR